MSKKLLYLVDLPGTQFFNTYELAEIIIIGKNKYFQFVAFQLIAPSLQSFNYGEYFYIESFVLSLCQNLFS